MERQAYPFGRLLTFQRKNVANMPQWLLAARCEIVASNLRKIEKGETQPGVMLAVRLLAATGADVGECFRQLAEEMGLLALNDSQTGQAQGPIPDELLQRIEHIHDTMSSVPCPFGPLLKEVRVFYGVSQKIVAEKAEYHLRNMLEVEKGEREPGVMTALAMVAATGGDVGRLMKQLAEPALTKKTSLCKPK